MKEVKFSKEEKELIRVAEECGFEQWGYRSWRKNGEVGKESLTKSVVNKGEWSLVREYLNGTRIKITTTDLDDISYYVMF